MYIRMERIPGSELPSLEISMQHVGCSLRSQAAHGTVHSGTTQGPHGASAELQNPKPASSLCSLHAGAGSAGTGSSEGDVYQMPSMLVACRSWPTP